MKLSQLTAKPKLIELKIDDEAIVKEYGETLEFYVYDRQTMDTFMKLATIDQNNFHQIADIVKEMVLDEKGKPILKGEETLPMDVMLIVIDKVVNSLGNPKGQTLATSPQS
jgi:hypothetical protein